MTVTITIAQKTKTPQKKIMKSMKTKKGEVTNLHTDHHTKTDLTEEWQGVKYRGTRQGHKMAIHQIRAGIILRRGINMEVVIQTSGKEIAALVGNITVHQSMLGDE